MGYITRRQRSIITDIEYKLGVFYETPLAGPTLASKFISKHIEALREHNNRTGFEPPPTGKQMRYIEAIEKECNVSFNGTLLREASEFIRKHRPDFQLTKTDIYA